MFGRKKSRIAVVSPKGRANVSPLDPYGEDESARKWTYYHRCLETLGPVKFATSREWTRIAGAEHVFVHEGLFDDLGPDRTIDALARIKKANGRVIWVELHEKSTYSGAVFLPGFFDSVDLLLKHQMLEFGFLRSELEAPVNRLAPHDLYGVPTYREFLADPRFFGFRIPDDLVEEHLRFDFAPVASKMRPLMYPFSWKMIAKGTPSYKRREGRKDTFAYAGRIHPNHVQRNALVAFAARAGLPVEWSQEYQKSLEASRFFLALGHIHSSLRTFDTLAFDTVLVHFSPGPYILWDEFVEGLNFLGFGDPTRIFSPGGFGMDAAYMREVVGRLREEAADATLVASVLERQRELFEKLTDVRFILGKLGVETPLAKP